MISESIAAAGATIRDKGELIYDQSITAVARLSSRGMGWSLAQVAPQYSTILSVRTKKW